MAYLADRLKERSTWAGIGVLVGILPLGIYTGTVQQALGVVQDNAPALVNAASAHDWLSFGIAACSLAGALLSIIAKTSRQ